MKALKRLAEKILMGMLDPVATTASNRDIYGETVAAQGFDPQEVEES